MEFPYKLSMALILEPHKNVKYRMPQDDMFGSPKMELLRGDNDFSPYRHLDMISAVS